MRTVFEPSFIAVGCNVVSSCLAWGARFAAFGAGNAVALLSPEKNAVVATFSGAGAPIHKVRWLDETTLFAVCNKGLLVIELDPARRLDEAAVTFKTVVAGEGQQFHGLSVVANARGKGEALVVIAGTHVVSFQYSAASRACTQDEEGIAALAARQLSECTAAALLPRFKVAIVAVGGADRRVHLYVDDGRKGLCYVAWLEGHQDWVRDLAFCSEPDTGDLLLASCSSDHFVRLWRVARFAGGKTAGEQGAGQESEDRQKIVFAVNDHKGNAPQFAASLDALLVGHSHFVHSVAWSSEGKNLISASMDKTMIVWEKDAEDQVWVDRFRVGEIGGNLLGFFGAAFSPDGGHVLGHSYNGSLHLWAKKANAPGFEPRATVSGHLKHVTDVSWDPKGRYLVSASHDQTARLWAPWIENGVSRGWFELARPQVHGHDINAISMLAGSYEHVLVSGADEKTVRVFGGTGSFVASLQNVSGAETAASERNRPFGATLPPLGLSNKPLNTINDAAAADEARLNEAFPDEVWRAQPVVLTSPPVETQLSQSTLWVEDQKLYGHGSELYAVASSHDGAVVASACKGKAKPHTDVLVWRTSDWTLACRLSRHKMTVTRIVFSPSDEFILTVSRDLRLCLWQRKGPVEYVFVWEQEKAHQRVIWDLCWSPQGDLVYTCSRDKKVCVWRLNGTELELANTVKRSVPLTAIAHHPSKPVLAVGNDSGAIGLWSVDGPKWVQLVELNVHGQLPVSRLAFKRVPYTESVYLASCGEDSSVRLTRVVLTDAFSQLVAFLLCARAVFGTLPQLVAKNIRKYL